MDWIERAFHIAPDGGNGSLEVGIIAGAAVALLLVMASVIKLGPAVRRWLARVGPEAHEHEPAASRRLGG